MLSDIIGSTLPICRKQIKALMLKGWTSGRVESAVKKFANPGMKPWDWTAAVTARRFRAEPVPEPLPNATWVDMAAAAGMDLDDWIKYHNLDER